MAAKSAKGHSVSHIQTRLAHTDEHLIQKRLFSLHCKASITVRAGILIIQSIMAAQRGISPQCS